MPYRSDMRAGRRCGTCWWFQPHDKTDPTRFYMNDGACCIHLPYGGFDHHLKSHEAGKYDNDWCSFWLVNLAADT